MQLEDTLVFKQYNCTIGMVLFINAAASFGGLTNFTHLREHFHELEHMQVSFFILNNVETSKMFS